MSNAMVVAEHLGKSFGTKRVLDDLSFIVEEGDVIGVLGKNGSGKTTMLEMMVGFSPATQGNVRVLGHDSFTLPAEAKARIGFVPQQDELLQQLKGREQLKVIASFYPEWDNELIERLVSVWELDLDQRVRDMSLGQRQKMSILLALGHSPDLLLLDEPVASLDPIARRQFLEQIVEIAADGQRAVVFSTHIVSDIERLANKIWILKDGHLFWRGDLDALKESIVRMHVRSSAPLPRNFAITNALSQRVDGNYATAIVSGWTFEQFRASELQAFGEVQVEQLSLEDIFLELHR
jgi:ABC-2 type transport system ATP-binding protein